MSALNANIGEYRLMDFIGAGGMGEVYRAVHTRLGRVIAIKILTQLEEPFVQRFQNEVRIQASLRHPAIAEYYGLHEYRGRPCLLMELVDGESLAERIRTRGALAPGEACAILRQVADAVGYVHSQGIVHRDLKANNIKITSAGQVKLLDFGIARQARGNRLTRAGMLIGTLENLAPEQIGGGEGDTRSDIWALGVLLYEMVTGALPFEGQNLPELYDRIRAADYTPASVRNRAVPAAVEQVIAGCLRKKPAQRYQSAGELIAALDAIPRAPAVPAARQNRLPLGVRGRWLAIGGAATVALAAAIIAIFSGKNDDQGQVIQTTLICVPEGTASDAGQRIRLETDDGPADIYKNDQLVGRTGCVIEASVGQKFDLELRRPGYRNKAVSFVVTERSATYTYALDPK